MFLSVSLGMIVSVVSFNYLVQTSEKVRIPLIERKGEKLPMEETHLKVVIIAWSVCAGLLIGFGMLN